MGIFCGYCHIGGLFEICFLKNIWMQNSKKCGFGHKGAANINCFAASSFRFFYIRKILCGIFEYYLLTFGLFWKIIYMYV